MSASTPVLTSAKKQSLTASALARFRSLDSFRRSDDVMGLRTTDLEESMLTQDHVSGHGRPPASRACLRWLSRLLYLGFQQMHRLRRLQKLPAQRAIDIDDAVADH